MPTKQPKKELLSMPPKTLREDDPDYGNYMCKTSVINGASQYIQLLANCGVFLPEEQEQMIVAGIRLGEIARARRISILTPKDKEDEAVRKTIEDMAEIKEKIEEVVNMARVGLERYSTFAAAA